MKANLSNLEPKMLDFWESISLYEKIRENRKGCEKYILHDGPPYANGLIHIGHALNKILKDIVVKYKVLCGFDCPFIVGWDCHGLPVEHQLFKELKLTKHDVEIIDFRKKAKEYALKFVDIQRQDFKRLALVSDWSNPYLTTNKQYESNVINLLGKLTEEGYIHRGRKPVNWCAKCETALAEAEVEYENKESDSIFVFFKLIDDRGKLKSYTDKDISFLVWTTTPWTLISNVAVAVHPNLKYSLIEYDNKFFVMAQDLIPKIETILDTNLKQLSTLLAAVNQSSFFFTIVT